MLWILRSSKLRSISKDGSVHVTDEFYNTWIAIAGLGLAIAGGAYLIAASVLAHKPWHVLGFGLYTFGIVALLLTTALHHGIDGSKHEEDVFRLLDYCAIFVMIAGAQSAFCLILARNPLGWTIFGLQWTLAVVGILLKTLCPSVPKKITTGIYLLMGWLGIFLVPALYSAAGIPALALLVAGGVIYTIGSGIFMLERPNPVPGRFGFHEIWHAMVVLASSCHFGVMVYLLHI